MLVLFGLAWWNTVGAEPSELYQRLGLEKAATSAEIRRAYHAQARHTHPDKVEGDKAVAAEKFKRLAEAYEVLTDKKLRVEYDRTGQIPDDRAKSAANQQSTGEEEEFGYGGARPAPSAPQQWGRRYESYDAFEVRLAQGRARRARSLAQLRKHLHAPNGTALRYGLVGFYRAGDEAALKERLKFPYPFAGWSLGREGSGFWCELQIAIATLTLAPDPGPGPGPDRAAHPPCQVGGRDSDLPRAHRRQLQRAVRPAAPLRPLGDPPLTCDPPLPVTPSLTLSPSPSLTLSPSPSLTLSPSSSLTLSPSSSLTLILSLTLALTLTLTLTRPPRRCPPSRGCARTRRCPSS